MLDLVRLEPTNLPLVILDTNVICGDYLLRGPDFLLLKDSIAHLSLKVRLPAVAVAEAINRHKEDLDEALAQVRRLRRSLNSLLTNSKDRLSDNLVAESPDYRAWLVDELTSIGVETLPYPPITHEEVVTHDLARKKPFKANGSGYRDFLIWKTVEAEAAAHVGQVVFITANRKDFADKEGRLAPNLEEELTSSNVSLCLSLRHFVDEWIAPLRQTLSAIEFVRSPKMIARIMAWLSENLLSLLRDEDGEEVGEIVIGAPNGARIWVSKAELLEECSVTRAVPAGDDTIIARINVNITATLAISVDSADFDRYPDLVDFAGIYDEFIHADWDQEDSADLTLDIVINDGEVIDGEIWAVSGSYGAVERLT